MEISPNSQHLFDDVLSQPEKFKLLKQRKSNVPFSTLLGPKCVRFADVVNNNICLVKRRRNALSQEASSGDLPLFSSESQEQGGVAGDGVGAAEIGRSSSDDEELTNSTEEQECSQNSQGLNLEVVLPFEPGSNSQSGLNLLLNEDSIQDVDGFIAARNNPEAKVLEAQKLLSEQHKVGFNFDQNEVAPIGRMMDMEDRDRVESLKRQGSFRPQ
jgi:hypothetical protein